MFAPVVRLVTFRALLVTAGKDNLVIKHFDAKTAFLNGHLNESVYMSQPEGYEEKGKEYVCKLHKSLYGLKQAAKVWYDKLNEILKDIKEILKRCKDILIYLIIYVDDILIAAETDEKINQVATALNKYFQLSDSGHLHHYRWKNMKVYFVYISQDTSKRLLQAWDFKMQSFQEFHLIQDT